MTKELKRKILFTIFILVIIQFISNIPAYGINRDVISSFINSDTGNMLSFFSMFSGNAFYQMSMFVLGISPYITASIVTQLLRTAIPSFDDMAKDGKAGEKRFKAITFILAFFLAIGQSIPIVMGFASYGLLIENTLKYKVIVAILLIIGSVILMLLSTLIDKKGIGKGMSLILLLNIISRLPNDLQSLYAHFVKGKSIFMIILAVVIAALIFTVTTIITLMLQDCEDRINTSYASKAKGIAKKANDYMPLKVNIAGVMPIIFTSSIFQTYTMLVTFLNVDKESIFYKIANMLNTANWFQLEKPIYNLGFIIYVILILLFTIFYSQVTFDTEKITKNLKDNDASIIGIRPGSETKEFLDKKLFKASMVGAIGLIIIATIPIIIASIFGISSLALGGTSIIILCSTIIDTYRAIHSEKLENVTSSFLF